MGRRCREYRRTFSSSPALNLAQSEGDIWYFPAGNPHSLQAKDTNPQGAEFLLIFDKGDFSEDSTFQLTDWLAHVPKSVVAKNFGLTGDLQAFDHIPQDDLYIFPCKLDRSSSINS